MKQRMAVRSLQLICSLLILAIPLSAGRRDQIHGLVTAPSGLRVRTAPHLKAKTVFVLPYKTVVLIKKKTGKRIFLAGRWGRWVRIRFQGTARRPKIVAGYVFGGFLFTARFKKYETIQYQYFKTLYPWLRIRYDRKRGPHGYHKNIYFRTRYWQSRQIWGHRITHREIQKINIMDYYPRGRFFLVEVYPVELPGPTDYAIIDDTTGQLSLISGTGIAYNHTARRFVTTGWGGYTEGSFEMYRIVLGRAILEQKKLAGPIIRDGGHPFFGRWISRWHFTLLPLGGRHFPDAKTPGPEWHFLFRRNRWRPVMTLKTLGLLTDSVHFEKKPKRPAIGLEERCYTLAAALRAKLKGKGTADSNVKYDPQAVLKAFGASYNSYLVKLPLVKRFYATYRLYIRALVRVYRILQRYTRSQQLVKELDRLITVTGGNSQDEKFLRFYQKIMVKHRIDMRARVMHIRRVREIVGFWIRRFRDGTAGTIYRLLGKVLYDFDRSFYWQYYRGTRILTEANAPFPRAILDFSPSGYGHLKKWTGYRGKQVRVIRRENRGLEIRYLISHGRKTGWVDSLNLTFLP